VITEPGDLLTIPAFWWHTVQNGPLEDGEVAIGMNWVVPDLLNGPLHNPILFMLQVLNPSIVVHGLYQFLIYGQDLVTTMFIAKYGE